MDISTTIKVRVRFSEVDRLNMVWHGNYVKYLEDAREEFGREWGISYRKMFEMGYYAPVYDMHLRYDHTALQDDVLIVKITYKPELGAKIHFEYEIRRESDNALILRASTIQLFTTVDGVLEPAAPEFYREWQKSLDSMPD